MNFKTIVKPMLLSEEDYPFDSKEYLYELKFDGIRALIYVSPKVFHIYNRHGKEITYLYPELKDIQKIVKEETVFDGEIVLINKGKPCFWKLQERSHLKDVQKIKWQQEHNPVCFIVFDILYLDGDVTMVPLLRRKKLLDKFLDTEVFIKAKYVLEKGTSLFSKVKKKQMEGIVAKKINSGYEIDTRSSDWIKIKNWQKGIFLVGGYEENKEMNVLKLYLGEYVMDKFLFVGKVSTTLNKKIYKELKGAVKCKKVLLMIIVR